MAVIERLLGNRGLKVVRQTVETVRIGAANPIASIPAYNQHLFVLNTQELPADTLVESDSNTARYNVYGAPETGDTMDEFTGQVNVIFKDAVFGAQKDKVFNVAYARVISGPIT